MNQIILFWAVLSGSVYQACIREGSQAQVCSPANGTGYHKFSNLKYETSYTFSYKVDGIESEPVGYTTPVKKKPTAPGIVSVEG